MADNFVAHDQAVIATGETLEQEEEFVLDDGVHTFLTVKFPIRDDNGEITAVGAIGTDITERKNVDEALRDRETKLGAIFDNISQGIHMVDRNLRVVAFNQNLVDMVEDGPERYFVGRKYADLVRMNAARGDYGPGDVEDLVRAQIDRVTECREHVMERTEPNGRVLEIRVTPMEEGGFVSTFTDITERKRTVQALKESQQILDSVVNAVPAVINVKDREGRYVFRNEYERKAYAFPEGDEVGRTPDQVLGDEYGRLVRASSTNR